MHYVYTLTDPRTSVIMYYGVTSNINKRFSEHTQYKPQKRHNIKKVAWIEELRADNLLPLITVIATFEERADALELEKKLIYDNIDSGILNIGDKTYSAIRRLRTQRFKT